MHSFRQSVQMLRDGFQPEALAAMRAVLEAVAAANEHRLNQPLKPFTQALTLANLAVTRLRGPARSACLDPENARRANACFERLFEGQLPQWTAAVLADPQEWLDKVKVYETQEGLKPDIPFETEADYYRLIVRDPLRLQEEYFVYRAILNNGLLAQHAFAALDLGTGSGRLAFCMADLLKRCSPAGSYAIYGLDINPLNIKDALESKSTNGYGAEVKFVTGDMCLTPFEQERFSLCSAASSLYLVPAYARPFCILEMVRMLKPGGEGVITGPNEYFSLRDYTYCMGATNFRTYIDPRNMVLAQKLGPIGVLIDRAAKQRRDFIFPDTSFVCLSLQKAGCDIVRVEYWPKSNLRPVYTAIHFRKSPASAARMSRYAAFMEKRIEARGVMPI